jgi:hypothetical protein
MLKPQDIIIIIQQYQPFLAIFGYFVALWNIHYVLLHRAGSSVTER